MRRDALAVAAIVLLASGVGVPLRAPTATVGEAFEASETETSEAGPSWTPCEHPYPCGGEWPADLEGPFPRKEVLHAPVVAHDGAILDGNVWVPNVPEGVLLPVVLNVQPYAGQCIPPASVGKLPGCMMALDNAGFVTSTFWKKHRFDELLAAGYAVAVYSVRGTGKSTGCFELLGPNEQRDQATLVNALANATWSNGRVAMWGISYMGTTPWMAAIQSPAPLKTIVAAGSVPDFYRASATPEGAMMAVIGAHFAGYAAGLGVAPPVGGWTPELLAWLLRTVPHPCEATWAATTAALQSQATDERPAEFFAARRLVTHFANITAAAFVVHGFQEARAHTFQDDPIWSAVNETTPKRMLLGQWEHTLDFDESLAGYAGGDTFTGILLSWLDFWLKGLGEPSRVGVVDHQDTSGAWHEASSWPPGGEPQTLHLSARTLSAEPGEGAGTFLASTTGDRAPDCQPTSWTASGTVLDFVSAPVNDTVQVAGNAAVVLNVSSNEPGGTIAADLYRIRPNYDCSTPQEGTAIPIGLSWITGGAADLRFHHGGYQGTPFLVGEATLVGVTLTGASDVLEPGDRLGLVLTGSGWWGAVGAPYQPSITLHFEGSQLVVPTA